MGIRIHKVMGYGIRGLAKNDPRLSEAGKKGFTEAQYETSADDFVKWAIENFALWRDAARREYPMYAADDKKLDDHLLFDLRMLDAKHTKDRERQYRPMEPHRAISHKIGDYEHTKVIVFTPLGCPQWVRYDDTIDYYEAGSGMKTRVVTPKGMVTGIYPWSSSMIRIRPPKSRLWKEDKPVDPKMGDHLGPTHLDGGLYNQLIGQWDPKQPPIAKGAALKHYRQDFRAKIPTEVIALVYWSGIARDPLAFINELRPMIYSYWN